MHAHIARFFRDASQDRSEILFRHCWSDTGFQFAHHAQEFVPAPFHVGPAGTDSMLGPNISVRKQVRQRRQHTDDCFTHAFKMNYPSNDVRVATELVPPEIVRDDQGIIL